MPSRNERKRGDKNPFTPTILSIHKGFAYEYSFFSIIKNFCFVENKKILCYNMKNSLRDGFLKKILKKIIVSVLVIICIIVCLFYWAFYDIQRIDGDELIKEVSSPDNKYTISAYLTNGGATTDYGVIC